MMIHAICSSLACLGWALAPGEVIQANQVGTTVMIETINHQRFACALVNKFYQCIQHN
jgi:hypothetical protein